MVLSYNNFTSGSKRVIAFNMRDILRIRDGEKQHEQRTRKHFSSIPDFGACAHQSSNLTVFFLFFLLFIVFHLEGLLNIGIYSRYSLDFTIVTFFSRIVHKFSSCDDDDDNVDCFVRQPLHKLTVSDDLVTLIVRIVTQEINGI